MSSSWNIQTETVGSVLNTVLDHLGDQEGSEGLSGNISDMDTAVQGAATECADSMPVSTAIGLFMENFSPICGHMVKRTSNALSGCAEATELYLAGDYAMAEEAQATRLNMVVTEDDIAPNL
ncbi:DUF6507 family protein [Nocardiopsis sp. L17-MgMaSL7]|uniref:DUF6507 family protein n=1 Tax=Nocardiopsis sp. L17-MgMaSL7 TaxID=1938893 RepID=UPI000D716C59|nr:DUF6507 family protein [Nocardiopsis sp. L17-MgMaSL7]PWV48554.1 hypothetical protein BDW27_110107 [Nocardiopsis sp. L17-MgMaSL7]